MKRKIIYSLCLSWFCHVLVGQVKIANDLIGSHFEIADKFEISQSGIPAKLGRKTSLELKFDLSQEIRDRDGNVVMDPFESDKIVVHTWKIYQKTSDEYTEHPVDNLDGGYFNADSYGFKVNYQRALEPVNNGLRGVDLLSFDTNNPIHFHKSGKRIEFNIPCSESDIQGYWVEVKYSILPNDDPENYEYWLEYIHRYGILPGFPITILGYYNATSGDVDSFKMYSCPDFEVDSSTGHTLLDFSNMETNSFILANNDAFDPGQEWTFMNWRLNDRSVSVGEEDTYDLGVYNENTITIQGVYNRFDKCGDYDDLEISEPKVCSVKEGVDDPLPSEIPEVPCDSCLTWYRPSPCKKYHLSGWVSLDINEGLSNAGIVIRCMRYDQTDYILDKRFNPQMGKAIDGWTQIEGDFRLPCDCHLFSIDLINDNMQANAYFDDIRLIPYNANMKSFVYDPYSQRLVAELDENNYGTMYEYDADGKLIRTKKETERGIKTLMETQSNVIK